MANSPRTRQPGPVSHSRNAFRESISPSGKSCSSAFAASTSSFHPRSSSGNRVNLAGSPPSPSSRSVQFAMYRPVSPNPSISVFPPVVEKENANGFTTPKKTCMCSPTNHPGSFRCRQHKNMSQSQSQSQSHTASYQSNRLNARRSAMTNSLVRIGTVEGELVKRALATLIRPSSHQQRRRAAFQPRPSRLSIMSKAEVL